MTPSTATARAVLLAFAAAWTLLNAFKPVHADDPAYLAYARRFADQPLSPYGGTLDLVPFRAPAMSILVPPVVPYWLALGMRLGGDDPVRVRLWLFPFVALLALAFHSLACRAGCRFPVLLALAALLSPAVLPGMNCMLDVPAYSLLLAAIAVQMRAGERRSWGLALLSGALAGLACQAKYNMALGLPLLALAGLVHRRWGLGIAAAVLGGGLAVAWEGAVAGLHGQSHFLASLGARSGSPLLRMLRLVPAFLGQLGAAASAFAALMLFGLGRPRLALALLAVAVGGVAALVLLPAPWTVFLPGRSAGQAGFGLAHALFLAQGAAVLVALALALRRGPFDGMGHFLAAWLVLEGATAFVLSPFPAARRLLGVVLVAALLAGRLAAVPVWGIRLASGCAALLGAAYMAADWADAASQRDAADRGMAQARGLAEGSRIWVFGWCAFPYYAERAGAASFMWNAPLPQCGDVIVALRHCSSEEPMRWFPLAGLELVDEFPLRDPWPVVLFPGYYAGRIPLSRRADPYGSVRLFRVCGPLERPAPR